MGLFVARSASLRPGTRNECWHIRTNSTSVAGGDTARFAVSRRREDIQIGEPTGGVGAVSLMVTYRWPRRDLSQHRRKYGEKFA